MRVVGAMALSLLLHWTVLAFNIHFFLPADGSSQIEMTVGYVERSAESFRAFEPDVDLEQTNKTKQKQLKTEKITIPEQQLRPVAKVIQETEKKVVIEDVIRKKKDDKQDEAQLENRTAPEQQVDVAAENDFSEQEDIDVEPSVGEIEKIKQPVEFLFEDSVKTAGEVGGLPGEQVLSKVDVSQSASPRYDINPHPEYPMIARKRGWEGVVMFEILVLEDGRVGEIEMMASSGYRSLDAAARKVVRRWKFVPATVMGVPIESQVQVPIRFSLQVP